MKTQSLSVIVLALITVLTLPSFSPVRPSAKTDAIVKEWERAKVYTKEYLDAATEDVYSFKPTPEMRSFGQQMLHLADGNYGLGSAGTGVPSPYKFGDLEKGGLKTKAEITKAVLDSYDFVIAGIKVMTDEKLAANIKLMGMELPADAELTKAFEHQTHHRGQATVYLRLKGIKPPEEKLF